MISGIFAKDDDAVNFSAFPYERPDFARVGQDIRKLLRQFTVANHAEEQSEILRDINNIRNKFETMAKLGRIRHTLNTEDEFYKNEQDYYDETEPLYQEIIHDYYNALVSSPFQQKLAQTWGKQLFTLAEITLKTFSPTIIKELQQENKLSSRYKQLLASAAIDFHGQERNLAQLIPFQMSSDRRIRKDAHEARYGFFAEHLDEFDGIYDQLVAIRTKIARKLGFADFTELGYLRMNRSDYNAAKVAAFRKEIKKHVVPLACTMREAQRKRLGLDNLLYYDERVLFPSGNAVPKGTSEEILAGGKTMYSELSAETGAFFQEMTDRGLLDLLSRKGKAAGGYCDYLGLFNAPFIFANFNGTAEDIDVLTHEAGHAFQVWLCRDTNLPEYYFATMEAAEIPSMGMEFLAWPWMDLFFADADKYRYSHMTESLLFLPYGALVDEFQHEVYANPNLTPDQRRMLYRDLERKYLPYRDYADNSFLDDGGYWLQQGHIFEVPFYYIDYVLAQTAVFQLWDAAKKDRSAAWSQYLALCRAGGSLPFTALLEAANLTDPFTPDSVFTVIKSVKGWLDGVDEQRF